MQLCPVVCLWHSKSGYKYFSKGYALLGELCILERYHKSFAKLLTEVAMSEEYKPLPPWHQDSPKEVFRELESEKDEHPTEEKKNLFKGLKHLPVVWVDGWQRWPSNSWRLIECKESLQLVWQCRSNRDWVPRPGDHIAVETKHLYTWWNHMIVTDVYPDGRNLSLQA